VIAAHEVGLGRSDGHRKAIIHFGSIGSPDVARTRDGRLVGRWLWWPRRNRGRGESPQEIAASRSRSLAVMADSCDTRFLNVSRRAPSLPPRPSCPLVPTLCVGSTAGRSAARRSSRAAERRAVAPRGAWERGVEDLEDALRSRCPCGMTAEGRCQGAHAKQHE